MKNEIYIYLIVNKDKNNEIILMKELSRMLPAFTLKKYAEEFINQMSNKDELEIKECYLTLN